MKRCWIDIWNLLREEGSTRGQEAQADANIGYCSHLSIAQSVRISLPACGWKMRDDWIREDVFRSRTLVKARCAGSHRIYIDRSINCLLGRYIDCASHATTYSLPDVLELEIMIQKVKVHLDGRFLNYYQRHLLNLICQICSVDMYSEAHSALNVSRY